MSSISMLLLWAARKEEKDHQTYEPEQHVPVSLTSLLESGFRLSCIDFPGRSTIFSRCPWNET